MIEMMAVVFMVGILAFTGTTLTNQQSSATQTQRYLAAIVFHARSLASTTTGGVTVALRPSDQPGVPTSVIEIYAGRPQNGTVQGALLDRAVTTEQITVGGTSNVGIFFGTNDHVALAAPWTTWTILVNEPGCPTQITFTIAGDDTATGTQLSCDNGTLN